MQKKSGLKYWKKFLLVALAVILVLLGAAITTVDHSPLEEQQYYENSKNIIQAVSIDTKDSTQVQAGWSKASITPDFPVKVIGFGKIDFFEKVMDSIFVSSIVFEQGNKRFLYLSYDLMIVHPYLVGNLESKLKSENLLFEGIYYSATHTHNSIGSYADKLSGWVAMGGKDDKVVDFIVGQTIKTIKKSISQMSLVDYKYSRNNAPNLVKNRLDSKKGKVDSTLRVLLLKNLEGKVLCLTTFSAHPTSLPRRLNQISADYPGELVKRIVDFEEVDFAIFSAGAVGSHGPTENFLDEEHKNNYAKTLSDYMLRCIKENNYKPLRSIGYTEIELPLRSPHLKIIPGIRLRPWLFNLVMGEGIAKLSFLKLNDVCFIGTPCDFSGEILIDIEKELGGEIKPVITSFNGEYIGYITPDKYYDWDTHEVRDVNWFGPFNGRYFEESIVETVKQIYKKK